MNTDLNGSDSVNALYEQALAQRKNLHNLIKTAGQTRMGTWSRRFFTPWTTPLPTDDALFHCVYRYAARILGKTAGSDLVRHFEASPNVLTANHQGLDCYSQIVQGTLFFALSHLRHPTSHSTCFPVLPCGNISLNNLTYPQGILLARRRATQTGRTQTRQTAVKIPIFPRRLQHALASRLDAYTPTMLQAARNRAQDNKTGLLDSEKKAVLHLLNEIYPAACTYTTYSDQCMDISARSWTGMFSRDLTHLPQPVYLGLEHLASHLLIEDLSRKESLMHALLFDPQLHATLLHALDGAIGCWSRNELRAIRSAGTPVHDHSAGTLFFWTVDHKGCKMAMDLVQSGGTKRLVPMGPTPRTRGEDWTPAGITEALMAGRILPSLFSSYTVLALARGLVCHGGIYQTEYLPEMQAGIVKALQEAGWKDRAEKISNVRTDAFCSGQNLAMARYQDGSCIPAGRIEFMAAGGITPDHLHKMADLTLREANLAALPETFAPFLPTPWQSYEGYTELTRIIMDRLGDKMPCFDIS